MLMSFLRFQRSLAATVSQDHSLKDVLGKLIKCRSSGGSGILGSLLTRLSLKSRRRGLSGVPRVIVERFPIEINRIWAPSGSWLLESFFKSGFTKLNII